MQEVGRFGDDVRPHVEDGNGAPGHVRGDGDAWSADTLEGPQPQGGRSYNGTGVPHAYEGTSFTAANTANPDGDRCSRFSSQGHARFLVHANDFGGVLQC